MATTKLTTEVTFKRVTSDDDGKETRCQIVKHTYDYKNFPDALFSLFEIVVAGLLRQ
jgi:hypothetical protein